MSAKLQEINIGLREEKNQIINLVQKCGDGANVQIEEVFREWAKNAHCRVFKGSLKVRGL